MSIILIFSHLSHPSCLLLLSSLLLGLPPLNLALLPVVQVILQLVVSIPGSLLNLVSYLLLVFVDFAFNFLVSSF